MKSRYSLLVPLLAAFLAMGCGTEDKPAPSAKEVAETPKEPSAKEKAPPSPTAVVKAAEEERAKLGRQADQEKQEILDELKDLEERRAAELTDLPPDILEQYERIAGGREGLAVVGVTEGVCQGCFINLTAQEINLLMGAKNVIRCKSCSRILFLQD